MKSADVFPSKYLKAEDLKNRAHMVTISHVELEPFTDDNGRATNKPVAYFKGKEKGAVLNKTNWGVIAYLLGDESDNWTGGQIMLVPELVAFKGQMKMAIRVKPPQNAQPHKPALPNTENPADPLTAGPALHRAIKEKQERQLADEAQLHDSDNYDDEIPF